MLGFERIERHAGTNGYDRGDIVIGIGAKLLRQIA